MGYKMRISFLLTMVMVWIMFISRADMTDVEGDVRLVDGANEYEGRVEIFVEGRWGTVCGRGFDYRMEGQVACRQLGYFTRSGDATTSVPVAVMYDAYFGENKDLPINLADLRCGGIEANLTMCEGGQWGDDVTDCDHSQDVGLICGSGNEADGNIRLLGAGVGIESEGRILIVSEGLWQSICDFAWDLHDADVACRQLGFAFSTFAARNSFYGGGNNGQYAVINKIWCDGTEDRLFDCAHYHYPNDECDYHEEDAGVICANETIQGTLRLFNGTSEAEGILQIYYDGEWGTICNDDSWSEVEALVACRQLGYDTVATFGTPDTPRSGIIQLDAVSCYGYELTVGNCAHGEWGNPSQSCAHDIDVWMSCENKPAEEGAVRLVDGFDSSEGRVEYFNDDGQWVTICDSVGDIKTATVVCRQLGYLTASDAFARSYFGEGTSDRSDVVRCNGYEKTLEDCDHNIDGQNCEYHQNDAGIICTDQAYEGDLRLMNGSDYTEGRLEIFHDGQWGSICNTNWFGDDALVACRQMGLGNVKYAYQDFGPAQGPIHLDNVECIGSELNITSCQKSEWGVNECGHDSDVGISCFLFEEPQDDEVRLTGGADYREGRVEIYHDDTKAWYGVCRDPSWGEDDARVVCNDLGLDLVSENEDFGPAILPVRINNVNCVGTESLLEFCDLELQDDDCGSNDAVGVICEEYKVTSSEGDIRLRDGEATDEGRIEIYHEGIWGYICKTDWAMDETEVACRQLGYKYVHETDIRTKYINRPFHLDNVRCDGDEEKLIECWHGPWGYAVCSGDDGVGIACSNTTDNPVDEGLEGWAIALIVIFSVGLAGVGGSALGFFLYKKKREFKVV